MRLSWIIHAENPDGSMLAHMEWHDRNLSFGTQIRSLRVLDSLNGDTGCASYWPPFVSLHPSLLSHWAALSHLAGFTFEH
jgi:hypothetical protein